MFTQNFGPNQEIQANVEARLLARIILSTPQEFISQRERGGAKLRVSRKQTRKGKGIVLQWVIENILQPNMPDSQLLTCLDEAG